MKVQISGDMQPGTVKVHMIIQTESGQRAVGLHVTGKWWDNRIGTKVQGWDFAIDENKERGREK